MPLRKCTACGKEFENPFGDFIVERTCPDCSKAAAGSRQPVGEVLDLVAPERPIITPVLIGLNVLVFVVMVALGVSWWEPTGQQGLLFGANFGPMTMSGQWWRLFTCMFVHFGILHIALNMWCLWNFGRMAEYVMGRAAYLVTYLAAGLFASVTSLLWNPMRVSAGASGAIFGIAGALVPYFYFKKTAIAPQDNKQLMGSLGSFILYNLIYGAGKSGIDNSAHLGGLVMGLIIGALLPRALAARAPGVSRTGQLATPDFFPTTQAADARRLTGAAQRPYPQSSAAPESHRSLQVVLVAVFAVIIIMIGAITASRTGAYAVEITSAENLIQAGKFVPAIEVLKKVVAERPEMAVAQYLLGFAYLKASQYPQSVVALSAAVALDPENFGFRHNLAAAYLGIEDYDQAIANFQKVLPKEQDDPLAHYGLGAAYLGKNRIEEAIAELKKAVALSPDSADIQDELGRAYFEAKKFKEARETFAKVLEKHPDDGIAQNGRLVSEANERLRPQPRASH